MTVPAENTIYRIRQSRPVRRTKLQEICGRLTEMAYQLGPHAKFPTVLQLRNDLGVSVATLNSALSELEAQRLIRRKHGVGIYVSPRIRHRAVALVCNPSFFRVAGASPFWSLLVDQVRLRAEEEREAFSFHFTSETPEMTGFPDDGHPPLQKGLTDDLISGRVDGVLSVGLLRNTVQWIERHHIPLVSFAAPGSQIVGLDSPEVIRLGVQALAKRGCKRIAFWSPVAPYRTLEPPDLSSESERLARYTPPGEESSARTAFARSLAAQGLPYLPILVKDNAHLYASGPTPYPTETHQEQGYRTAMEVFGPDADPAARPDGILSSDDMMIQGALTAMQKLGVRIGEEVHIATHANVGSPTLIGWEKEMILIEIDPSEIVRLMFDTLEILMNEGIPESPVHYVTPRLRS